MTKFRRLVVASGISLVTTIAIAPQAMAGGLGGDGGYLGWLERTGDGIPIVECVLEDIDDPEHCKAIEDPLP